MTENTFTRLRQSLAETASSRRAESYEMVNARPGAKIAAMIELLAELRSVPISSMLTDDISEQLATYAASDARHAPAVLNAVEAFMTEHGEPSPESALGRLISRGLLQIETDNPILRSRKKISFASSKGADGDTGQEGEG